MRHSTHKSPITARYANTHENTNKYEAKIVEEAVNSNRERSKPVLERAIERTVEAKGRLKEDIFMALRLS